MNTHEMLLRQAMATPGFQMILKALDEYADGLQREYDGVNFVTEPDRAMRIQLTREIIKVDMPKIMEKIMNIDKPEPRWSFKAWLRSVLTVALVLVVSAGYAASPLERDADRNVIQGPAPNGLLSQILTVNSTTIDMSKTTWWGLYAPTACKYRLMPTSAKGAYPQFTVPEAQTTSMLVNRNTKFVNYSGCTSGELSRF